MGQLWLMLEKLQQQGLACLQLAGAVGGQRRMRV